MPSATIVSVNGQPIAFSEEEIQKLNTRDSVEVWNVFHAACKRFYKYNSKKNKNTLKKEGVDHIKSLLKPKDVKDFKKIWEENLQPVYMDRNENSGITVGADSNKKYSVVNYQITPESIGFVTGIIPKILNNKITAYLEDYFESHFSISLILFAEAFPDPEPITSFRWHRDVGPLSQTHIMVYLDGAEETGGRTDFINYADSQKLEEAGYTPGKPKDRRLSIKDISDEIEIISPKPEAGDALIFNATRIFHCGVHPIRHTRKVMFLILRPDFRHWAEASATEPVFGFPTGRDIELVNPFIPYFRTVEL